MYKNRKHMKKLLFFLLLSVSALTSCQSQPAPGQSDGTAVLEAEAYKAKMAALGEVQLLDVRTPEEYGAGHIEGATLINFFDADFVERTAAAFDKDKPLMLYCRSGNRSAKATAKLKAAGFKEIIDLKGGYNAWPKQ